MTVVQDAEATGTGKRQRELWVDNLRVLVIAGVIIVHTATGYVVDIAGWYYDDERTTSQFWSTLVTIPAFFGAVFALGPLFVVAGWFSARSIARRGPGGFAWSRFLRLGVPVVVYVVAVQPLTDYLGNIRSEKGTFTQYLRTTEVSVMWFAAALLAFSLVYAAWEFRCPTRPSLQPLRLRVCILAVLSIGLTSFAVWQVWPLHEDVYLNLRIPAWPQGAVLFALGVHAAHGGWLAVLSRRLQRVSGWVVVAATVALVAVLAVAVDRDSEELETRADVPTLLFALLDGVIAVAFALWLLAGLQHRWSTHGPLMARAARGSFATYFIHPLILTVTMLLFASVPVAPEFKFVLVSAVAIPACFAVGYGLTRLRGISRVL